MKITLIQESSSPDQQNNIQRGLKNLERAARSGAQLVVYPELAFQQFFPQRPASGDIKGLAEPVPGPTTDLFCEKAREFGLVVILNLFEIDAGLTYDSTPVIDTDGSILGVTRMVHIADHDCFYEKSYYTPGNRGAPVYTTAVGKIGVAICYDRHYPEYMRALALRGAELVVVPQAGTTGEWPPGVFEAEMQVASLQNGYYTALVNRVGIEDTMEFAGESFVTAPDGQVIARAPGVKKCLLSADVDLSQVDESVARRLFMRDRRPDQYPL